MSQQLSVTLVAKPGGRGGEAAPPRFIKKKKKKKGRREGEKRRPPASWMIVSVETTWMERKSEDGGVSLDLLSWAAARGPLFRW